MASQTFLAKLYDEFLKSDAADPRASAFLEWAETWLAKNPPVGTGFADGTSAITVRFQNGDQYPLSSAQTADQIRGRSFQITGQADKLNKSGTVSSPSVQITGN